MRLKLHFVKKFANRGEERLRIFDLREMACLWNEDQFSIRNGGSPCLGTRNRWAALLTFDNDRWQVEFSQNWPKIPVTERGNGRVVDGDVIASPRLRCIT